MAAIAYNTYTTSYSHDDTTTATSYGSNSSGDYVETTINDSDSSTVIVRFPERKVWHTVRTSNQNENFEEEIIFPEVSILDHLPKQFKEIPKILPKSQTYKRPIRKQFTSMFALSISRNRDFSKN